MENNIKKVDKNLIILKSLTIGLGLVFITLLVALVIIKSTKSSNAQSKCASDVLINVTGAVEKIEINNGYVFAITKINDGKEVIKVDSCGNIVSKFKFKK